MNPMDSKQAVNKKRRWCVKHHDRKNVPQEAKILEWHGFLGFPTRIRFQLTNMEQVEWVSRSQRKRRRLPFTGQTRGWWESERISQWMCVLFMIGSFLLNPTLSGLLYLMLTPALLHRQIMREENFLKTAFGPRYADYAAATPRYL